MTTSVKIVFFIFTSLALTTATAILVVSPYLVVTLVEALLGVS